MKTLGLLLALTGLSGSHAAQLPAARTPCANFVCFKPAPHVSYLGTDSSYSSVRVMFDGTLFRGEATPTGRTESGDATLTSLSADLHGPDGRTLTLTATFRKWITVINAGRLHTRKTNIELVSGTLEAPLSQAASAAKSRQ